MNLNSAIMEVRSGTGGQEASLWASELLRMYARFAGLEGWKIFQIDDNVLKITGPNAYTLMKNEAGVHRVQRVPKTERQGRIHTSTATVAVLPEIEESQVRINPADLDWQFFRASSKGGQNVQKVSSAVRLIHRPSGIVVTCQEERFQERNRLLAIELLRAKLWEKEELNKEQTMAGYRSPIGRGMRSEKIRTYNFPQDRITDHRINKSWRNMERILDGDLKPILSALQEKI